jgi:HD-GYP domain-containing protein (c-di-GMP phosphodiesterase class II)
MSSDRQSSIGPSDSRLPSQQVETIDLDDDQDFGVACVDIVYKLCKVGSIFGVDHEQTEGAIDDFMTFFRKSLAQRASEAISFQIRGEFALVDETQLRLPFQSQKRLRELRDIFGEVELRGTTFRRGLTHDDLDRFLEALHRATESDEQETLESLDVPHVELEHGRPTRPIAEALGDVTREMYVSHLYVRWLVKVRHAHRQLRESPDEADVSVEGLERIVQNVAKQFREGDFTMLSLPPLEILSPSLVTHSVHASLYAMLLCDRLGLPARMTGYLGAAVVAQDFDRLRGVSVRRQGGSRDVSLERLFAANRRDVTSILDQLDGHAVSALRSILTYERGLPWNETLASPFYRRERDVHVANRIVDVARQYDLLAQGLKDDRERSPKRALDLLRRRAGDDFDPALVQLFTAAMGAYPVGTQVALNTGDRGVVVRPPEASESPTRPSLQLVEREGRPTVDLSNSRYERVEIAEVIEPDEQSSDDDVFILT